MVWQMVLYTLTVEAAYKGIAMLITARIFSLRAEKILDSSPADDRMASKATPSPWNDWFTVRASSHVLRAGGYITLSMCVGWYALSQYTPNDIVVMWFLLVIASIVLCVAGKHILRLVNFLKFAPTSVE